MDKGNIARSKSNHAQAYTLHTTLHTITMLAITMIFYLFSKKSHFKPFTVLFLFTMPKLKKLNNELYSLFVSLQPFKHEIDTKKIYISILKDLLLTKMPDYDFFVYGSFATNLSLKDSDVDITLIKNCEEKIITKGTEKKYKRRLRRLEYNAKVYRELYDEKLEQNVDLHIKNSMVMDKCENRACNVMMSKALRGTCAGTISSACMVANRQVDDLVKGEVNDGIKKMLVDEIVDTREMEDLHAIGVTKSRFKQGKVNDESLAAIKYNETLLNMEKKKAAEVKELQAKLEELEIEKRMIVKSLDNKSKAKNNGKKQKSIEILKRVKEILKNVEFVDKSTIILVESAKVPLLKFKDAKHNISFDFTIDRNEVHAQTEFVNDKLRKYKNLKVYCVLIKHLLRIRGLNETFRGGLNSYGQFLMFYHFYKLHPILQIRDDYENIAVVLMDFLQFYGSVFNYETTALDTNNCTYIKKYERLSSVCILDPADGANVTSSCTLIEDIKTMFEHCYKSMKIALDNPDDDMSLLPIWFGNDS